MALILGITMPPLHLQAASLPTTVPVECLADNGRAVEPRPDLSDAWLLLLNFNHVPSVDTTLGCIVTRTGGKQIDYTLIECRLNNNLKQMTVGGGAANFDGYFWIECTPPTQELIDQATFDVTANAQFARPGNYTLMNHVDAAVSATVDVDWHIGLASRYHRRVCRSQCPDKCPGADPGSALDCG